MRMKGGERKGGKENRSIAVYENNRIGEKEEREEGRERRKKRHICQ